MKDILAVLLIVTYLVIAVCLLLNPFIFGMWCSSDLSAILSVVGFLMFCLISGTDCN